VLLPDDGIGVVLASNWQNTDAKDIVSGVLDLILSPEEG
jgi:hypothetical protein